jgi:hypothetical protein
MSESSARASVYVFAVSSALVALGFIGQLSDVGDVFNAFALTVLPTLYVLGAVTFVRLVECGAEDRKPFFAFSTAILVIDSVVGGAAIAVATGAFFDAPLGLAVGIGIATAIVSFATWIRYAGRLLDATAARTAPLFPSPARSCADRPTS